jgi:hypothetical protein
MKWKNCSLDLEQFNCPAADTYLFLGHLSPVLDLVCNSVIRSAYLWRSSAERVDRRSKARPNAWWLEHGLWNRIARLLDAFQPDECANYFRNAGYAAC